MLYISGLKCLETAFVVRTVWTGIAVHAAAAVIRN